MDSLEPNHSAGFSQDPAFYSYKMVALTPWGEFQGRFRSINIGEALGPDICLIMLIQIGSFILAPGGPGHRMNPRRSLRGVAVGRCQVDRCQVARIRLFLEGEHSISLGNGVGVI